MRLTVAVIGAPHDLKGKLHLDVHTDQPERRLGIGAMLETDPQGTGPLTATRTREYKGAIYAMFSGYMDQTMTKRLRGVKLIVETDEDDYVEEDAFYEHEFVGLEVLDPEGYELERIIGLETFPAQDIFVIREPDGDVARVPFVRETITEIDLDDNCVVIRASQGFFSADDEADGADLGEKSDGQREEAAGEK